MQIRNQILQADRPELYNPPFHIVSHQENHKCGLCQHPDSSRFVHEAVQKYSLIKSVYRNTDHSRRDLLFYKNSCAYDTL